MPVRFQKAGSERSPHFIKAWRLRRDYTLDRLADRLGDISKASLSRLETGKQPYTQDVLEALADALDCTPADLISRDPAEADAMWAIWDEATGAERNQIETIARALVTARKAQP